MNKFEVLCVTMHQRDFSKIKEMNIHSDVVFANQCDRTAYEELEFEGYRAKMISTQTRGVGINRNLSLSYASADICLLSDDDVSYNDYYRDIVLQEFNSHCDADIFIFHLDAVDSERAQKKYPRTRRCYPLEKMPWGAVRVAFRLSSIRKANIWFTTLFGGGADFPSGEDSKWLTDARRAGLKFYVSDKTIGTISFASSSWYSGCDEKFFYGKGAFYQDVHPRTKYIWMLYFIFRTRGKRNITVGSKMKLMMQGASDYKKNIRRSAL